MAQGSQQRALLEIWFGGGLYCIFLWLPTTYNEWYWFSFYKRVTNLPLSVNVFNFFRSESCFLIYEVSNSVGKTQTQCTYSGWLLRDRSRGNAVLRLNSLWSHKLSPWCHWALHKSRNFPPFLSHGLVAHCTPPSPFFWSSCLYLFNPHLPSTY